MLAGGVELRLTRSDKLREDGYNMRAGVDIDLSRLAQLRISSVSCSSCRRATRA